jgi:spermidine/putrescine transport system permease protein
MATDPREDRPPSLAERDSLYHRIERIAENHGRSIGRGATALLFLYLWAPIAVLVFMSFAPTVLTFPPERLTLRWYAAFLDNEAAIRAIVLSLQISLPVTLISVVLATLIAYAIDRYEFPGKDYLQVLATLPLIVPLVVGGVALVFFFGLLRIDTGYTTVVIAHVVRSLPFSTLIVVSVFLSFDRTLEEVSMDLGADEFQTFRRVTLPQIMPGIVAGGLLAFTISFNEFVYTFFIKSSSTTTLPIFIWEKIRYGVTPEVNVISVVFLVVAATLILAAVWLTRVETITGQA